ncbi:hypothetical protein CRENBAI_012726, partial [Crenichthys baileyi]
SNWFYREFPERPCLLRPRVEQFSRSEKRQRDRIRGFSCNVHFGARPTERGPPHSTGVSCSKPLCSLWMLLQLRRSDNFSQPGSPR